MTFIDTHALDRSGRKWLLLEINLPVPKWYTDCEIPIVWNGYRWSPRGFAVGSIISSGTGGSCSLSVPDADLHLFPALAETCGGIGMVVNVYEAHFSEENASAIPTDVRQLFAGRITSARKDTSGGRDEVEFQCGPIAVIDGVTVPARLISSLMQRKDATRGH